MCVWGGGGGGLGTFGGEHSVEDHYLHINGKIFGGGGSSQFLVGRLPPKTGLQETLVLDSSI